MPNIFTFPENFKPSYLNLENWLASISSDLYVTEIGLTTSHNSMAYKSNGGSGFGVRWKHFLNQDGTNLEQQFAGGVRKFSLKTSTEQVNTDFFRFEHNVNDVGDVSTEAFRQLFASLANNPSEFVVFNIEPYDWSKFNASNPGVDFWDTSAGKRVHSYFFEDGRALNGTPRKWSDSVFNQWVPSLPEEKRNMLRGRSLFYIPRFGADLPTIPKISELRGKFILGDESWTRGKQYSNAELKALSEDYAKDFPNGISYDQGRYRFDGYDNRYYFNQRWDNRNFIDRLLDKPSRMPSFLGIYNADGYNVVKNGLPASHDYLWFDSEYLGDNGSPSFKDVLLEGKGLKRKPPIGSITGEFFTDFAAMKKNGKSPAGIIASLQPRIDLVTGLDGNEIKDGKSMRLVIKENLPTVDAQDFLVAFNPLTDSLQPNDFKLKDAQQISPDSFPGDDSSVSLSDMILFDPGNDADLKFKFIADGDQPEYFSLQLVNRSTGDFYGAPLVLGVI